MGLPVAAATSQKKDWQHLRCQRTIRARPHRQGSTTTRLFLKFADLDLAVGYRIAVGIFHIRARHSNRGKYPVNVVDPMTTMLCHGATFSSSEASGRRGSPYYAQELARTGTWAQSSKSACKIETLRVFPKNRSHGSSGANRVLGGSNPCGHAPSKEKRRKGEMKGGESFLLRRK